MRTWPTQFQQWIASEHPWLADVQVVRLIQYSAMATVLMLGARWFWLPGVPGAFLWLYLLFKSLPGHSDRPSDTDREANLGALALALPWPPLRRMSMESDAIKKSAGYLRNTSWWSFYRSEVQPAIVWILLACGMSVVTPTAYAQQEPEAGGNAPVVAQSVDLDRLIHYPLASNAPCLVIPFDGLSTGEPEPTMEVINPATGAGFTLQTTPESGESTEPPTPLLSSILPLAPYTDTAVDQPHLMSRWNAFLRCSALGAYITEWTDDAVVPESSVVLTYPASGRRFVVAAEGLIECGVSGVDWPWDGAVRNELRAARGPDLLDYQNVPTARAVQMTPWQFACGELDSTDLAIRLHTVLPSLRVTFREEYELPGTQNNRASFVVTEESALLRHDCPTPGDTMCQNDTICTSVTGLLAEKLIELRRCAIEGAAQPRRSAVCGTGLVTPQWNSEVGNHLANGQYERCTTVADEISEILTQYRVVDETWVPCWPPTPD